MEELNETETPNDSQETPLGEQIDGGTEEMDDRMTDGEADADVFASIGWGTDEDYGCYND